MGDRIAEDEEDARVRIHRRADTLSFGIGGVAWAV
jgi:hypothetical protein